MVRTVALRYGGIALQFVILMILARHLRPDEYGRYMLVLSAVLPTYFLLGLGISETFVREAPALTDKGDLSQFYGRVVLSSLVELRPFLLDGLLSEHRLIDRVDLERVHARGDPPDVGNPGFARRARGTEPLRAEREATRFAR